MTLLELRRYAIRKRTRVRFTLPAAGECMVNEHGVVKIPALRTVPDFNVEASLGSVEEFVLEPAQEASKPRKVSPEQMAALLGDALGTEQAHQE